MLFKSIVRAAASAETERMRAQVRAALRSLVLTMAAGLLFLVALVFVLTGAYASLSEQMPGWQAGGIIGLATLAVCLLLLLAARSRGKTRTPAPRPRPRAAPSPEDLEATAEMGAAASTAAREFVQRHRPSVLELTLAAFIVGMVTSRRRRPRN